MNYKKLLYWIKEREAIRVKKEAGEPKPWTQDKILQQYRFCNVHREDDTVTRWIAKHWRTPHAKDEDLWFAMVVARLFNRPETLANVRYPVPWDFWKFWATMKLYKHDGNQVFNGAYIVSTNGHKMDKVEYLVSHVLQPLWEDRRIIRTAINDHGASLQSVHSLLTEYNGLGSFMAAQVIADLKYVNPLKKAGDWWTWAAPGPGSQRGLNVVYGRPFEQKWRPQEFLDKLNALQDVINDKLPTGDKVHAQDLQNCLCEFSKYHKVLNGLGRPKSLYNGAAE